MPAEAVVVAGDRDRLAQVVTNLVANAIRYTQSGGRVVVELAADPDAVEIAVTDTGSGIAAANLPHVFNLYFRGRDQRPGDDGLGVGLHLVRELTHAHSGEVSVTSAGLGHGARFVVRLPRRSARPTQTLLADAPRPTAEAPALPKPAAGPPVVAAASTGGERPILVIEDDDGLRAMLVALLAADGFTARTASTGAAGLAQAAAGPPIAAIICDLGLPDIPGVELLPRLRALPGHAKTPAAAFTGWGERRDLEETRRAGFDQHWVKPVETGAVVAWLRLVTGDRTAP